MIQEGEQSQTLQPLKKLNNNLYQAPSSYNYPASSANYTSNEQFGHTPATKPASKASINHSNSSKPTRAKQSIASDPQSIAARVKP